MTGARADHSAASTSASSVPASASRRTTSPSRSRASGPPAEASGVTWIAAGTLPVAPDMRPSVTSATVEPRSCSTPSVGVSLCSSGMPLARGPWKRTTTTTSRSSSPALKAASTSSWSAKHARRRLDRPALRVDRAGLEDARGRGCRCTSRMPPSARNGSATRAQHRRGRRSSRGAASRRSVVAVEHGLAARSARRSSAARRSAMSACSRPASSSSRIDERHAAGGVEVVHVGRAVGIDARDQRHRRRQLVEVLPVDRDAGRARDRRQVDRVVGRAAGREQADHAR